ncbi:hypothetical protein PIB30_094598 [Stylosanthes scabra]|uniref:Uncharacterized protein n=1 Tax=Stylosanthes scabra TaxID=79078 RepID=A0ABU6RWG3_9FABA|nr:hypothetical protein [Stylosanthes scabra]
MHVEHLRTTIHASQTNLGRSQRQGACYTSYITSKWRILVKLAFCNALGRFQRPTLPTSTILGHFIRGEAFPTPHTHPSSPIHVTSDVGTSKPFKFGVAVSFFTTSLMARKSRKRNAQDAPSASYVPDETAAEPTYDAIRFRSLAHQQHFFRYTKWGV